MKYSYEYIWFLEARDKYHIGTGSLKEYYIAKKAWLGTLCHRDK